MKSLQSQMIWKVLFFILPIFLISGFATSYILKNKLEEYTLSTLEYIRDSKYNSLNNENLQTAFDFGGMVYTSYILNDKLEFIFPKNWQIDKEIKDLCSGKELNASEKYQVNGESKFVSIKKNGNYCLVYESNSNQIGAVLKFIQEIFFGLLVLYTLYLLLLLTFSYKKISTPIKTTIANAQNALVSKWENLRQTNTNINELVDLEKNSIYLIEILKQKTYGSDSANLRHAEIKEFESRFMSKKLAQDANKFKLAVDSALDIISITDKFGYVNYVNKALTKLTDITFENAENKKITDLWHKGDDTDIWKKNFEEVLKTKNPVMFSTWGTKKNNLRFEAEVQISPIKNADDSVDSFLIIERDVTEERQKEKIKNEFVSVVSHELRTPMTVIRGYSTILAEGKLGPLTDKQKEYIEKINNETGQLLELANDMLDLQKFESGRIELTLEKTDIFTFVKDIVDGFADQYSKKGLILNLENHLTHTEVNIDHKYFARVITNLMTNAYKYTPKGEVKVFLINPDEHTAVIAVKDTGVGISDEAMTHLFERFYQAQGVLQRKQEGTGLGLSIIKRVTEAHSGLVWVESKLNVGSTFYVAIPTV